MHNMEIKLKRKVSESFLEKEQSIKALFANCTTSEERYDTLIQLGKEQKALPPDQRTAENLVPGCQSKVYLHAALKQGKVFFEAESDALITAGLVALLIRVYSGETPETILKIAPTFLDELQIPASLSPTRAGGLYQIHLKMKQEALRLLLRPNLS